MANQPEGSLGFTRIQQEIIKCLVDRGPQPTIKSIERGMESDYKNVYVNFKRLEDRGVVKQYRSVKRPVWWLSPDLGVVYALWLGVEPGKLEDGLRALKVYNLPSRHMKNLRFYLDLRREVKDLDRFRKMCAAGFSLMLKGNVEPVAGLGLEEVQIYLTVMQKHPEIRNRFKSEFIQLSEIFRVMAE
jgi:hypothetical protein